LVFTLYAQEIIPVKGVVFNEKTHEPLTGVEIWVEETGHFAISDDNGFFQFMRLKPGFYHLHFYRIGFQPQRKQIHVVSESSLHIEILLKPDILVSDTIQVIASRQISGFLQKEVNLYFIWIHLQFKDTPFFNS
jgi:hypothetical protein